MRYVLLLLLFDQVQHYAFGVTTVSESKRQISDATQLAACLQVYNSLSTEENNCLTDSYDFTIQGLLSPSDFGGICASEFCKNVATRLLDGCKGLFQDYLPVDYQDISSQSFVNLLCARDFSGIPCYSQLPLNYDVLFSCQSVPNGNFCDHDCRNVLAKYNTTCCFASLLSLQPGFVSDQLSNLWRLCGLDSSPKLCHMSHASAATGGNSDKDESSGSNEAYIIAGIGGFVILSVIIIVIVVVIVLMKKHSRSQFGMNSGDIMRMPLPTEDPDH